MLHFGSSLKKLSDLQAIQSLCVLRNSSVGCSAHSLGLAGTQGNGICRAALPQEAVQKLRQSHRHKMAVIIPYRDRLDMLNKILPALHSFLKVQSWKTPKFCPSICKSQASIQRQMEVEVSSLLPCKTLQTAQAHYKDSCLAYTWALMA